MGRDILRGFAVDRVLSSDERKKSITVLGTFQNREGRAVVTLRRRHFEEVSLPRFLSEETTAELHFENDIYTKYTGTIPAELGQISIDIIHPATDKHISKHEDQQHFMVSETPEMYAAIMKPYIESIPASRIQWVYNILAKKAEADRLIFEDADPELGFVLHPDLKWDERQREALYCIAMVNRRDIRSLRDLRGHHLPLLQNILKQGTAAIMCAYAVAAQQIRVYLHYQPSYYHLHVHFLHVKHDAGMGMAVGKAHLLSDVIGNIQLEGDYYALCTLHTIIGEKDPVCALVRSKT